MSPSGRPTLGEKLLAKPAKIFYFSSSHFPWPARLLHFKTSDEKTSLMLCSLSFSVVSFSPTRELDANSQSGRNIKIKGIIILFSIHVDYDKVKAYCRVRSSRPCYSYKN